MRALRRTLLIGCLALVSASLGACQDSGQLSAAPTTAPATSAATHAATTPGGARDSDTEAASPSAAPSGVIPAAGPELHLRAISVHAPVSWTIDTARLVRNEISASSADGLLQLIEIRGATRTSTAEAAKNFIASVPYADKIRRLPDVLLGADRTPAARVTWTEKGSTNRYEAVMAFRNGVDASLNMTIRPSLQRKDPHFVDSVLATVRWLA